MTANVSPHTSEKKSRSLLLFELTYVWMIQYLHYSDFPEELLRDKATFNWLEYTWRDMTSGELWFLVPKH